MITLNDIFAYDEKRGLLPTGILPKNLDQLQGIDESLFAAE